MKVCLLLVGLYLLLLNSHLFSFYQQSLSNFSQFPSQPLNLILQFTYSHLTTNITPLIFLRNMTRTNSRQRLHFHRCKFPLKFRNPYSKLYLSLINLLLLLTQHNNLLTQFLIPLKQHLLVMHQPRYPLLQLPYCQVLLL